LVLHEKIFWPILCRHTRLCVLLLLVFLNGYSQSPSLAGITAPINQQNKDTFPDPVTLYDSISWQYRGTCKGLNIAWYVLPPKKQPAPPATNTGLPVASKRAPLLTVHGNVQYNFLYRSFVDTPFSQNNFQQHTIQTFLTVTVKDKYPLKVNLSQRISNSPYFRNFLDLNAQFDRFAYLRNARQQLLDRLAGMHLQRPDLAKAEKALKELTDQYNALKSRLNGGDVMQRIVEERERNYHRQARSRGEGSPLPASGIDPPAFDQQQLYKMGSRVKTKPASLEQADSSYTQFIDQQKKELDSLQQKMTRLQSSTDSLRTAVNKSLIQLNQQVYKATSLADLNRIEMENGLSREKPKGIDRFLTNLKSIGIGRSVVNYSELTAWNVSLTGFNMEYNPGIYTAIAAGKIDYGFRDFLGRNSRQKGQNFLMGRIGIGNVEKKAIIFSAFTGRKYNYDPVISDTVSSYVNLAGYSVEAIFKKDENTGFSAEIAKTTKPVSGPLRNSEGMKSLWQFSDNANLGISLKGQTLIPKTGTRLSGLYRKTGESFQSFSLFTYNTDQTAWSLKADQPIFKNRVSITGMLRRNDFISPFTEKTFKTSTVFKSIQVNIRVPKWPALSMGYYPGTQLYIVDKERIRENAYYMFNGSLLYQYAAGNARMLSSLIYNRYSGKGTDSGFIAYTGVSYMASHTAMFHKVQLQGAYVFTDQEQMQFYTLEANADYSLTDWLQAGAGIKYNKIAGGKAYNGSRGSLGIDIKKLGGLRLQYEKSYLPTIWQTLYPVETGTVSWFKYF
jgi:hypothetical protein